MSLNIKDPEAHKLAQELARETGESMTSAVIQAIRERLEAIRRRHKRDAMTTRISYTTKKASQNDPGYFRGSRRRAWRAGL